MKAFVYRWTNHNNLMKYIGSHIGDINDGYIGSGKYFINAYNKNPEFFYREILEVIESEDVKDRIKEREEYYLKLYDVSRDPLYYNITDRYFGGNVYSGLSEEDKKIMINKTVEKTKEDRINNPEKWRLIYSNMSKSKRNKSLGINQFDNNEILINSYSCIEEAHEITGISKGNIHSALTGKRNNAGGFRWSFTNVTNPVINKKCGRPKGIKNNNKIERLHTNIRKLQVIQYDLQGNLIRTWESALDAAKELGLSYGSITHFVNDRKPKIGNYGGFIWRKGNYITYTVYK